jgi:PHD/YefM family antitoxin component YafN of YafNO toxin-antitoxin module
MDMTTAAVLGALDAEITVSDLRNEATFRDLLKAHHGLRLLKRSQTIGVILDAQTWKDIQERLQAYEARLDAHEEDRVREIIAERLPGAVFANATPEILADIERVTLNRS